MPPDEITVRVVDNEVVITYYQGPLTVSYVIQDLEQLRTFWGQLGNAIKQLEDTTTTPS